MSKLREAAQAALNQWDKVSGVFRMTAETEALRAALAQPESRPCTCHPDDNPPQPCAQRYALTECKALAQPETEAGVSWGGHSVRGDADSIAEVRRLIDFEQARQGAKPATGDDLRVYDAIAANYNAQPEPVAWRTFDGEGGYDYRDFYQNEAYELEWKRLNPAHADWVTPLYAHPPRDEWRLASEPPEDGRDVVVWMDDGGHGCFAIGHCLRGEWSPNYLGSPVTHWRDVSPPAENQR